MPVVMYDSIELETIPADAQAVAGYTAGKWPTWFELAARWPSAQRLSIAIAANDDADCLDVESGDATPDQAPAWVRRQQARGVARPVLYMSLAKAADVLAQLHDAGIRREHVRVWTAHYTGSNHICRPACGFGLLTVADATQWTDKALGRNLDCSLCSDTFFAAAPAPRDPQHYGWFELGPFPSPWGNLDEREIVKAYDAARPHWIVRRAALRKLRDQLGWLAGRVLTVAHEHPGADGKPSWGTYHRGWRYQQLIHRSQGRRLA